MHEHTLLKVLDLQSNMGCLYNTFGHNQACTQVNMHVVIEYIEFV